MTNPVTLMRQAVADVIAAVDLTDPADALTIHAHAYIPEVGRFPVAFTELGTARRLNQFSTRWELDFDVIILVGAQSSEHAQEHLDALLFGDGSLVEALRADPTLGGTVHDLSVGESEPLSLTQLAGYQSWGRRWPCSVGMTAD